MSNDIVVSYRNSTSNHNSNFSKNTASMLYLIEILHQTTTRERHDGADDRLYLIEILHQTTTNPTCQKFVTGCILSKFYIKPQQAEALLCRAYVVSYRNSTSNHNSRKGWFPKDAVVSYRNSTSNHNVFRFVRFVRRVVSYRNSTSNHNDVPAGFTN